MKNFLVLFLLGLLAIGASAQSTFSAQSSGVAFTVGAGMDYWATDYSHKFKFGPAIWGTAQLNNGLGIIAEGHSLVGGSLPPYKFYVGEGGPIYSLHHWRKTIPYAKAEIGFGSLTVPKFENYPTHYTRTTYAVGGGVTRRLRGPLSARLDYTYEWFPNYVSPITAKAHTLNPNGLGLSLSYDFHRSPGR